jgi:hypothetical protein
MSACDEKQKALPRHVGITDKEVDNSGGDTNAEVSLLVGAATNIEDQTKDGVKYSDKKKYLKSFINEVTS